MDFTGPLILVSAFVLFVSSANKTPEFIFLDQCIRLFRIIFRSFIVRKAVSFSDLQVVLIQFIPRKYGIRIFGMEVFLATPPGNLFFQKVTKQLRTKIGVD